MPNFFHETLDDFSKYASILTSSVSLKHSIFLEKIIRNEAKKFCSALPNIEFKDRNQLENFKKKEPVDPSLSIITMMPNVHSKVTRVCKLCTNCDIRRVNLRLLQASISCNSLTPSSSQEIFDQCVKILKKIPLHDLISKKVYYYILISDIVMMLKWFCLSVLVVPVVHTVFISLIFFFSHMIS